MKHSSKGFTLVELLVTLAIIGVLVAIVLAGLDAIRAKGRDSKRIADIKQLQGAIENYFDSCYTFPASLSALTSTSSCYSRPVINALPKDPNGQNYGYYRETNATRPVRYHLCATLEYAYGSNKGKAGTVNFVTGDGCNGTNAKVFDVIGGSY